LLHSTSRVHLLCPDLLSCPELNTVARAVAAPPRACPIPCARQWGSTWPWCTRHYKRTPRHGRRPSPRLLLWALLWGASRPPHQPSIQATPLSRHVLPLAVLPLWQAVGRPAVNHTLLVAPCRVVVVVKVRGEVAGRELAPDLAPGPNAAAVAAFPRYAALLPNQKSSPTVWRSLCALIRAGVCVSRRSSCALAGAVRWHSCLCCSQHSPHGSRCRLRRTGFYRFIRDAPTRGRGLRWEAAGAIAHQSRLQLLLVRNSRVRSGGHHHLRRCGFTRPHCCCC
jgi:hypothetical protein